MDESTEMSRTSGSEVMRRLRGRGRKMQSVLNAVAEVTEMSAASGGKSDS